MLEAAMCLYILGPNHQYYLEAIIMVGVEQFKFSCTSRRVIVVNQYIGSTNY